VLRLVRGGISKGRRRVPGGRRVLIRAVTEFRAVRLERGLDLDPGGQVVVAWRRSW
jgi:hypothetical protein